MTDRLVRALDRAVAGAERRSWLYGRIGRKNEDGSLSIAAPDRPGFVYVRLNGNASQTVDIALGLGSGWNYDLPVKLKRVDGILVIKEVDDRPGVLSAYTGGGTTLGAPKHSHTLNSGMTYPVELLRVEGGRVSYSSGVTIRAGTLFYAWGGVNRYFAGDTLSLSSYLPATSGKWAWVLVCLDPDTNALTALTGAEYAAQVDLTDALIADIETGYYIPLAAVQCRNGDTSLSSISRYRDARRWIG